MRVSPDTWDLLVVGGGTAGIVGAKTAAGLGARVAIVERARTGGDCLWTGCVPSKALLAAASAASAAAGARRAHRLVVGDVAVDFAAVMRHVHGAIATIEPTDSPAALGAAGVEVLSADARFSSPRTVQAAGRMLRFHHALVATGAAPVVPDVPGLRTSAPLTSDTVWNLEDLPARLVVMGGGTIGCELAQAFARLGSHVTVVESAERLLPQEDPDASSLVRSALQHDGVVVLTDSTVVHAAGRSGGGTVTVEAYGGEQELPDDALLVAVGRRPGTAGLGLDAAGVILDERGTVEVDQHLRTTNPRVWAAGDVTGFPRFTHVAGVHGSIAATNAVLGSRRTVSTAAIPRVTFTDPEVAAVGAATWSERGPAPRTVTRQHRDVDRAVAEDRADGFARLALDRRRRIVGATVVGPRAGESLAELVLAVDRGLSTSRLAGAMHAYPTYGDGPWHAAIDDVQARLAAPVPRTLLRLGTRARRVWSTVRAERA